MLVMAQKTVFKSFFLSITAAGLTLSGFIFPQQAPGLLAGGAVTGMAVFLLDSKDKQLVKKVRDIENKEHQIDVSKKSIEDLRIRL
ncbi:MAG TPA: hypothetical protein VIQ31_12465, partial [Phormidium sp.]